MLNTTISNLVISSYMKRSPVFLFNNHQNVNVFSSTFNKISTKLFFSSSRNFYLADSKIQNCLDSPVSFVSELYTEEATLLTQSSISVSRNKTLKGDTFKNIYKTIITISQSNVICIVISCKFLNSSIGFNDVDPDPSSFEPQDEGGSILSSYYCYSSNISFINSYALDILAYQESLDDDNLQNYPAFYFRPFDDESVENYEYCSMTFKDFNISHYYVLSASPPSFKMYFGKILWIENCNTKIENTYMMWDDEDGDDAINVYSIDGNPMTLNDIKATRTYPSTLVVNGLSLSLETKEDITNVGITINQIDQVILKNCGFIGFNNYPLRYSLSPTQVILIESCCFEIDLEKAISSSGGVLYKSQLTSKEECDLNPFMFFVSEPTAESLTKTEKLFSIVTLVLFISAFVIIFAALIALVWCKIGDNSYNLENVDTIEEEEENEVSISE